MDTRSQLSSVEANGAHGLIELVQAVLKITLQTARAAVEEGQYMASA